MFAPFLAEHFDAMEYASTSLSSSSATAQAKAAQLQQGIKLLDDRIAAEIQLRQENLLQQAESLREAQAFMQGMNLSVESLHATMQRVRGEVLQPYATMRVQTMQMGSLHRTSDVLRHVLQRLKHIAKLRALDLDAEDKNAVPDAAKAARLLTDVAAVSQEMDLSGLALVDADSAYLDAASQKVQSRARKALREGMAQLSQADVGSALQIFYNLQMLPEAVRELVEGYVSKMERLVTNALDARRLASAGAAAGSFLGGRDGGRGPGPNEIGSTAKLAEILWQSLTEAFDSLHSAAVAVWHLQRVLAKKRDPLSHTLFSDALETAGALSPLEHFWELMTASLRRAFADAAGGARAGTLKDIMTAQYSRLAQALEDVIARLIQDTEVTGVVSGLTEEEAEALMAAIAPFQQAYLGACLTRMSDAATAAFPGGSRALPTSAELQKFIGRMHEELKSAGGSARLASQVASCISKALQLLAEKAEYMAATGPDVRQMGGACTSAQLRNITLCSQLNEVHRSLMNLLPRLPAQATANLRAPLEAVQSMAVDAVMPIFRAAVDAAEQHILRMHAQDFGRAEAPAVAGASPYMADLVRHISHCRVDLLSKFSPSPSPGSAAAAASFAGALVERMAGRVLVFFVRHASLLRPLSQAGKVQLAKDMAELEAAVADYLLPVDAVGAPHRVLRAFRPLIFLGTPELAASLLVAALPPSIVLHHMYSRAPAALQSPHIRSGFTPAQYSMWLDQHSMEEALKFIRSALEACAAAAEKEPGFSEVYPFMLQLSKGAAH
ncbi:hypothetical protein CVIRNUC_007370 [Coccomyxa viridis]|uniref:Conserved oligomeric Golgi complex subunit 5 n=1 Tax=Coccomyxa viridis TaxID=1274662 RepID=A0AAV1ID72_9CHLO|nr:hypothetical protein CVIRNUC_007370 [Coccomyxa viridis]